MAHSPFLQARKARASERLARLRGWLTFRALLPTLSRQWLCNRLRIFLDLTARGPERSAWVGPVLVVDARQENLFAAEEQALLRTFYPQAELVTIDLVGHGSALKALDAHIAAYAAFLERVTIER